MNRQDKSYSRQNNQRSKREQSSSKSRSRSRSRDRKDKKKDEQKIQWQPTKSLSIQHKLQKQIVQQIFDAISIRVGTSLPDDVDTLQNSTIIKYPSIDAASKIINQINKKIKIKQVTYNVQFYPKRDATLIQDWYCQKCNYANFARRNRCNKCDSIRTNSCQPIINSNYIVKNQIPKNRHEINPCSLMLRGLVITTIDESVLVDIFQHFGSIKDVRLIKNRQTGENRDFAFIEFYTPEEAAVAFKQASNASFRIHGQQISCLYSKNRKDQALQLGRDQYNQSREPKPLPPQNYSQRQWQRQIKQERQRQIVTIQQLKERKQQQLKKQQQNIVPKQLSKQKMSRKQAQQQMKKWQKSMKTQIQVPTEIMYICPICVRKFKDPDELKNHEEKSAMHKQNYDILVK